MLQLGLCDIWKNFTEKEKKKPDKCACCGKKGYFESFCFNKNKRALQVAVITAEIKITVIVHKVHTRTPKQELAKYRREKR